MEEIFHLVNKELRDIKRDGLLPAGVVLTGGGAKLPDLIEAAKKQFRLPASLGVPRDLPTAIDKIQDPAFTTATGLVRWGMQYQAREKGFRLNKLSSFSHATEKMQRWFRSLLP